MAELAQNDDIELGNLLFGNSRGKYVLDRYVLGPYFTVLLEILDADGYGYLDKKSPFIKYVNERGGITTDRFEINPYYWGDDEAEEQKPNFIDKETGVEIHWYKYPFRNSFINVDCTEEELKKMCESIISYLLDIKKRMTDR